jgi:hypothetical protein
LAAAVLALTGLRGSPFHTGRAVDDDDEEDEAICFSFLTAATEVRGAGAAAKT